jgi:putative peptide zinc metalloprotease protein
MSAAPSDLVERLSGVIATGRRDLEVTRDVFQDEPAYILRDPLIQKSHRLSPENYEIFCRLDDDTTLEQIFDALVDEGRLSRDDEVGFYEFIIELHRSGLLNLPISDDKTLYDRYRRRRLSSMKQQILGFLFMKVPIFSPDRLLEKTRGIASFLFSRGFVAVWAMGLLAASFVLFARRDELENPISAIVDSDGAFGMILALIGLKVIHEFGHAWACKLYGGRVPVMGAMFVVFTPLAYVDASAAWGFENKWQRIVVNLAGMYFETIVAIAAVFVWANTEPGYVNSLAYQVIILATIVTIGFNANPLMRFDGYYVMADWLGIPNLRERAARSVVNTFDRVVLGLPRPTSAPRRATRMTLFSYGIASVIYKVTLVLGICTMIALKSFYVGIALVTFYLSQTLIGSFGKVVRHLFFSPETADARLRAATLGVFVLFGIPAMSALAPVSLPRTSSGVVEFEDEASLRVARAGFLVEADLNEDRKIAEREVIALIVDPTLPYQRAAAESEVLASKKKIEVDRFRDPAGSAAERVRLEGLVASAEELRRLEAESEVRAPFAGRLISKLRSSDRGRWLEAGEEIARSVRGDRIARFLFAPETLEESRLELGDTISCRLQIDTAKAWEAEVISIAPAASREIRDESLTHLGGGEIVVDPKTGLATSPYVEVAVRFPAEAELPRGLTVQARLSSTRRPLSSHLFRAVVRFADEIRTR